MSPAVQKGPLGDLHANGPSPREERVEATPRRLTQGATARLGDLALLRSILRRRVTHWLCRPTGNRAWRLVRVGAGTLRPWMGKGAFVAAVARWCQNIDGVARHRDPCLDARQEAHFACRYEARQYSG
jgi:hypothetical protein